MDVMKMKARELADRGRCVRNEDGTWTVFSLSNTNKYRIALDSANGDTLAPRHTCTCSHFEIIQSNCKHIRAVLSVIAQDSSDQVNGREPRERVVEGEPIRHPRQTFRQPDWKKYNLGQASHRYRWEPLAVWPKRRASFSQMEHNIPDRSFMFRGPA
jgi:hypothetical protein